MRKRRVFKFKDKTRPYVPPPASEMGKQRKKPMSARQQVLQHRKRRAAQIREHKKAMEARNMLPKIPQPIPRKLADT